MWLRERKIKEMKFCHIHTGSREEDNNSRRESTTEERKEIQSESEEDEHTNITKEKLSERTKAIRNNSLAASAISGKSLPPKLEEKAEQKRTMKKNMTQRRKATVMVTSGALTFILLAATLVTATFLMSPVIEQIFSKYYMMEASLNLKLYLKIFAAKTKIK